MTRRAVLALLLASAFAVNTGAAAGPDQPQAVVERLQAALLELLPGALLSRDNLASMQLPSVCADPFPAIFGFQPCALEAIAPAYLANATPRGRYDRYRATRANQA